MDKIRAPRCPGCDAPPKFTLGPQAFCGTDPGCKVLSWDMRDDPAKFKATAYEVDLSGLAAVLPPDVTIRGDRA